MDVERELRPFRNLVYAVALFTAVRGGHSRRARGRVALHAHLLRRRHRRGQQRRGHAVVGHGLARRRRPHAPASPWRSASMPCSSSSTCFPRWKFHGMPSTPRDLPGCCDRSRGHPPRTCCRSAFARHTRCAMQRRYARPALAIGLLILGAGIAADLRPHPSLHGADLARHHPAFAGAGAVPVARSWAVFYWRLRGTERLGPVIVLLTVLAVVSNVAMLYSEAPADRASMLAHAGRFANGLFLLFTVTQMGSIDTARRMRVELRPHARQRSARRPGSRENRRIWKTPILRCVPRRPRARWPSARHSISSAACACCSKLPMPSPNARTSSASSRWW